MCVDDFGGKLSCYELAWEERCKQATGSLFEVARGAEYKLLVQRNVVQRLAEAQPGGFGEVQ